MIACKPNIEEEELAAVSPKPLDHGMPFFPAEHTALYFTPIWQELSAPQQLRYTQLYGLYVNEQTAFFEESLARTVLPALYKHPNRIGTQLAESLKEFEMDERRHTSWFRELNHHIAPGTFSLVPNTYYSISETTEPTRSNFCRTIPCLSIRSPLRAGAPGIPLKSAPERSLNSPRSGPPLPGKKAKAGSLFASRPPWTRLIIRSLRRSDRSSSLRLQEAPHLLPLC